LESEVQTMSRSKARRRAAPLLVASLALAPCIACGSGDASTRRLTGRAFGALYVSPPDGAVLAASPPAIHVELTRPLAPGIDATSLVRVFDATGRDVRGSSTVGRRTPARIEFVPDGELEPGVYTIVVAAGVRARDGETLRREHRSAFAIDPPPAAAFDGERGDLDDILDALLGTWTERAPLPTARGAAGAVLLSGRIHVVGGSYDWSGSIVTRAHEVYDPLTDSWSSRAPLPDGASWDAETQVVEGRIFAMGGWPNGQTRNRAYDPVADTWSYRAPIPRGHEWGHATAVLDGEIYVIGGSSGSHVDVYDPKADTWRKAAPILRNRARLTAEAIDGRIYVAGTGSELQIYDAASDSWTRAAELPVSAHAPASAVLEDKLYVFGGAQRDNTVGSALAVVQVYDPDDDAWDTLPGMPTPRSWACAVALRDRLHVLGGLGIDVTSVDRHEVLE
jgi:N-acetylneuraminic acid mutarotase